MDALESNGRLAGDSSTPGFVDWLRGIFARILGGGATVVNKTSTETDAPETEEAKGEFVVAPGGYRIRIPTREVVDQTLEQSIGNILPGVRDALATVPPLPHVVIELLKEVQNPASTAATVAKIAASDPALATSLLRTVNSAAFGLNRKVTSVTDAINYLGFSMVKSIVVRLRLDQVLPRASKQSAADAQDLWVHCLAVSYIVDCLADRVPDVDRGLASTLGLLHDIGKLAIVARLARVNPTNDTASPANNECVSAGAENESAQSREKRMYGLDHAGLGAALSHQWGLPADLVQAIRWHHNPEKAFEATDPPPLRKAVYLVQVANELSKYAYPYADDMELDAGADAACESLGLGDSVAKLMDDKVRGAITRAILFASESSDSGAIQPRRFVRLRSGEAATRLVGQSDSRNRVRVDAPAVKSAMENAGITVELTGGNENASLPSGLASALSARFVAPASARGVEKLLIAVLTHQQGLPLASAARGPAGFIVRALLPNLVESEEEVSTIEIVQSAESGKLMLAVHSAALSFDRRLASGNASDGCQLVEAELANVLILDWFQTVTITPDGSGWVFAGR